MMHGTSGMPLAQRGFTLMEMLVTLVIMSMISTLLWQAMQQVARVERMLQSAGATGQLQMVRREWLRALMEATLPEQNVAEPQFSGAASEFQLASAEALSLPGLGVGPMRLLLKHDARNMRNRLMFSAVDREARSNLETSATETSIIEWSGPATRFRYLDHLGQWQDQWPLPNAPVRRLPAAVMIEFGEDAGGPLVAAVAVNELPRLRRMDWERR